MQDVWNWFPWRQVSTVLSPQSVDAAAERQILQSSAPDAAWSSDDSSPGELSAGEIPTG